MVNNKLRVECLDLLRFPLAIIVVLVHVFSYDDVAGVALSYIKESYSIYHNIDLFIDAFFRGLSVPIYFFISGYTFFNNVIFDLNVYKNKLKNRIYTLLIPYIIWNGIAILLIAIKDLPLFSSFLSYTGTSVDWSLRNIISAYIAYDGQLSPPPIGVDNYESFIVTTPYPINTALWFLRDLMVVVVSTPVLYFLMRKLKSYSVIIFGLVYFIVKMYIPDFGLIATAFFFFVFGSYMSVNKVDIINEFRPYFTISGFLYIIGSIIYIIISPSYPTVLKVIKLFNTLIGLVFSFNLAAWFLSKSSIKVNPFLAKSSFFIYVSHCLIVHRVTKLLLMFLAPSSDIMVTLVYCLSVIITVTSLLLVYYFMASFTPRFMTIVTGRK